MYALISSVGGLKAICATIAFYRLVEEYNIPINITAGNSGGAIALGFLNIYGYEKTVNILKKCPKPLIFWDIITYIWDKIRNNKRYGFLKIKSVRNYIKSILKDIKIGDLKTPFYTHAYCLNDNKGVLFSSTTTPDIKLADAILASSAIPLLFEPYIIDNKYYWDGGIIQPAPLVEIIIKHNVKNIILILSHKEKKEDSKISKWIEFEEIMDLINYYKFNRIYEEIGIINKLLPNVKIIKIEIDKNIGLFDFEEAESFINHCYNNIYFQLKQHIEI